jgi:hypothetical protein
MENVGKALWTIAMISIHSSKKQPNNSQMCSGKKRTREVDVVIDSPAVPDIATPVNPSIDSDHAGVGNQSQNEEKKDEKRIEIKRTQSGRIRKEIERWDGR